MSITSYSGNGGSLPLAGVATKTPEMEMVRNELEKAVSALFNEIDTLEAQLQPVLLPDTPSPNKLSEIKDVMHSQSVAHLISILSRVNDINRRVEAIKERLEV